MGEQLREPHTFRLFDNHLGKSKAPLLHSTLLQLIGIPWSYEIHETSDLDVMEGFIQGKGVHWMCDHDAKQGEGDQVC